MTCGLSGKLGYTRVHFVRDDTGAGLVTPAAFQTTGHFQIPGVNRSNFGPGRSRPLQGLVQEQVAVSSRAGAAVNTQNRH